MLSQPPEALFWTAAALFAVGGLFHLRGAIWHRDDDEQSRPRHVTFVFINSLLITLMLWHPSWIVIPYAGFVLHQLSTHGRAALKDWKQGKASAKHTAVVIAVNLVLALLIWQALAQRA